MADIRKVAVIGAGVMGAQIAAHVTNAGVPVALLDIVPEGARSRNALAEGAIAKLLKANPAPLMHKRNAKLLTPGNTEDDLELLADCDWIIEAVIEKPEIKHKVYQAIDANRKEGSIVSSNTSTLPLAILTKGMSKSFKQDFLITHFFNPPRYMRLLELITGPDTSPQAEATITAFADQALGKGVVKAKDTPGFIANRIGTFWLLAGVVDAMDMGVSVEEADAVLSRPVGIPKTGVFGLLDLVGIDLMPHILGGLAMALPKTDMFHQINRELPFLTEMVKDGYTGRKGKGGFYRLDPDAKGKVKQARDFATTGEYRKAEKPRLACMAASKAGGPQALFTHKETPARYAASVMSKTLAYAASLVPEISDEILAVDEAMRTGYNWKLGPFEMIDKVGPAWLAKSLEAQGIPVPPLLSAVGDGTFYRVEEGILQYFTGEGYADVPRPDGVLLLSDIKRRSEPLIHNGSASLWDIGDEVACLEFHSKMNAIDTGIMEIIAKTTLLLPTRGFKALVIHNEATNFSVGANIGVALFMANIALWDQVHEMLGKGQKVYKMLKYAPFPVVGAPSGMALGGGCEVLLHCDAVQAHSETYIGLVEAGVGLVPGWGGCKEMLHRWATIPKAPKGPMVATGKAFEIIGTATVAKSAVEAMDYLYLRPTDGITMNRERILADAKAKALSMAKGYKAPEHPVFQLPGPTGRAALDMAVDGLAKSGKATPYDVVVAGHLAEVLSGGDTDMTETLTEDDLYRLEFQEISKLVHTPGTLARMEHMLTKGKPLRN